MFEGMDAGTPLIIVIAVILVTFGVRVIDYMIVRLKQKKYNGENDRRRAPVPSNPGNPSNGTAVSFAKIDMRLENLADKLSVFHRDFSDKENDQTGAIKDVATAIREMDRNEEERHKRVRASLTDLQTKVDANTLTAQTTGEKVDQLRSGK